MSIHVYPEYRDSGVAWIGSIPTHWGVKRAKYLFTLAKRPVSDDDGIVTAFRDGQVTLRSNRRTDGFTNAVKEIGYQGVRKGDLVIHAMDAFAGAVGVSESDGKCSPVYSCCIPGDQSDSEFYARLVRTMATTGFIESLAKGIRERSTDFRWGDFYVQYLPHPPLSEQIAIREYLRRETARIDNLIAEKQNFINLLKEKRQALISHVVTKGLDPKAKMKGSGIEWIGDMPAHWGIKKLKHIGNAIIGLTYSPEDVSDSGVIVLRSTNIQGGKISLHDNVHVTKTIPDKLITKRGDILICSRNGSRSLIGKNAIIDEKSENLSFGAFTTVFRSEFSGFVHLVLSSALFDYQAGLFLTTTVNQLTTSMLNNFEIPFPPIKEQLEIVSQASKELARLHEMEKEVDESISLLKEHRTALISAAVTGKIDVREQQ